MDKYLLHDSVDFASGFSDFIHFCIPILYETFVIILMHFFHGRESINLDLQRGLDRRLRHTQH